MAANTSSANVESIFNPFLVPSRTARRSSNKTASAQTSMAIAIADTSPFPKPAMFCNVSSTTDLVIAQFGIELTQSRTARLDD